MLLKIIQRFIRKRQLVEVDTRNVREKDLIRYLKSKKRELIALEVDLISKSENEIDKEFTLGLRILDYNLPEFFDKKTPIIIIPPKYEFWVHFFFALKLVLIGYPVNFLYFGWAKKIIHKIEKKKTHLQYKNLNFYDVEKFEFGLNEQTIIFNFSESFSGVKSNVPSFSTAIVTKQADIDFALAYILNHAYSFAGLKKSNLKRIIVDKAIEKQFLEKLLKKIQLGYELNSSYLRSERLADEIRELVSEAVSDGAELIWGDAEIRPDNLPQNIVLTKVHPEMRIFQKKFYGPLLIETSTDMNKKSLEYILSRQPSLGVVVFGEESFKENLPKNYIYAFRNPNEMQSMDVLLHEHPSLEYLFAKLGL